LHDTRESTRSEERIQEILDAARRCFAAKGYQRASIKAIAREAGIRSPSILHYHFASKQALFLAVMRSALTKVLERAMEAALLAEGPKGLGALEAVFTLLDEESDLAPLMIQFAAEALVKEPTRDPMLQLFAGLEDMIDHTLRELLGEQADRLPVDRRALARILIDLLSGHAIRMALQGSPSLAKERLAIRTLLGLLRPRNEDTDKDAAPVDVPHTVPGDPS
jgi:AcrR family transcriptional regulator